MMDKLSKFSFFNTIAWQIEPVNGFVYIYNVKRKKFIILEDVSKEVWIMIERKKCLGDIIELIAQDYEVEYSVIEQDIIELINELIQLGVLEQVLWSSFFVTFVPNTLLDCCSNHIWSISVNQGCFASPTATSP